MWKFRWHIVSNLAVALGSPPEGHNASVGIVWNPHVHKRAHYPSLYSTGNATLRLFKDHINSVKFGHFVLIRCLPGMHAAVAVHNKPCIMKINIQAAENYFFLLNTGTPRQLFLARVFMNVGKRIFGSTKFYSCDRLCCVTIQYCTVPVYLYSCTVTTSTFTCAVQVLIQVPVPGG